MADITQGVIQRVSLLDRKALNRFAQEGANFRCDIRQCSILLDYANALGRQIKERKSFAPVNHMRVFFKTLTCQFNDEEYNREVLNRRQTTAMIKMTKKLDKMDKMVDKLSRKARKTRRILEKNSGEFAGVYSYTHVIVFFPIKNKED